MFSLQRFLPAARGDGLDPWRRPHLWESNHYDPTALVQDGVIVVTINYRLGALGFLAHPAFAGERRMRIGTATAIPIPLVIMASWISNSLSAGFATTSCSSAAIR
jgi:hypothetical protein